MDIEEEKKLDAVGKEDGDIDNDGDTDKSDKYLIRRRRAIKKAMKEEFKAGSVKLKDGSRVKVSKEEAAAINTMINELSGQNQKKAMTAIMADEASFKLMLGVAKEA